MDLNLDKALEMIIDKIKNWFDVFVSMLPNMAAAVILLIVFIVLAKLGAMMVKKIFSKTSDNVALKNLFSTTVQYTIIGLGIFIILGILKLDKAVTSLLAGVGIIGLALGFAFQDITANFVSGIIIAFRRPFMLGDIVEVNDIMGIASRTNLRVTVIKTFQGQEVYIPNKDVLQSPIYNFTTLGKRRIDLTVGVSYGDDLEKVESLVKEAIKKLDGIIDPENTIFDYEEFGSSSINFNIRFWIEYPDQPGFLQLRNQAIKAIKQAFDENDITIPFPIRTLDFGIKGGQKLSDMQLSTGKENRSKTNTEDDHQQKKN
ncbi:MAG: mechanosensitive ion channel [Bacteroidetes bacterium]|nr:mechanosensitive ion channel [Bacteroidota bacterium]